MSLRTRGGAAASIYRRHFTNARPRGDHSGSVRHSEIFDAERLVLRNSRRPTISGPFSPDLAQFSVHAGGDRLRSWRARRPRDSQACGRRPAAAITLFELHCTPVHFNFASSRPSLGNANRPGRSISAKASIARSRTGFSAHFSVSHEAKPQISGLRPLRSANREPSQV